MFANCKLHAPCPALGMHPDWAPDPFPHRAQWEGRRILEMGLGRLSNNSIPTPLSTKPTVSIPTASQTPPNLANHSQRCQRIAIAMQDQHLKYIYTNHSKSIMVQPKHVSPLSRSSVQQERGPERGTPAGLGLVATDGPEAKQGPLQEGLCITSSGNEFMHRHLWYQKHNAGPPSRGGYRFGNSFERKISNHIKVGWQKHLTLPPPIPLRERSTCREGADSRLDKQAGPPPNKNPPEFGEVDGERLCPQTAKTVGWLGCPGLSSVSLHSEN